VPLYSQLQSAKSEEDVKDAYIKALGLKGYTKGLIDIQTDEIWFEAKDTDRNSRGDTAPVNFGPFEAAYQALTGKLQPRVFSLGFLC
jgi:hypothetical protein